MGDYIDSILQNQGSVQLPFTSDANIFSNYTSGAGLSGVGLNSVGNSVYTPLRTSDSLPFTYGANDVSNIDVSDSLFKTIGTDLNSKDSSNMFGFLEGDALGNIASIGQFGLGYLGYKDKKKMNDATRTAMSHNLAQSRKEAALDDAYRASYGA